jgi:hypothetical protein
MQPVGHGHEPRRAGVDGALLTRRSSSRPACRSSSHGSMVRSRPLCHGRSAVDAEARVAHWLRTRSFHHADFRRAAGRRARRHDRVCVPARTARDHRPDRGDAARARGAGAIDEVVVVDADSADATASWPRGAREGGRRVACCPTYGPVLGKGDAMWRALSVVRATSSRSSTATRRTSARTSRAGPSADRLRPGAILSRRSTGAVRGGRDHLPTGGGRVTELTAKPLLRRFWPELAGSASRSPESSRPSRAARADPVLDGLRV